MRGSRYTLKQRKGTLVFRGVREEKISEISERRPLSFGKV